MKDLSGLFFSHGCSPCFPVVFNACFSFFLIFRAFPLSMLCHVLCFQCFSVILFSLLFHSFCCVFHLLSVCFSVRAVSCVFLLPTLFVRPISAFFSFQLVCWAIGAAQSGCILRRVREGQVHVRKERTDKEGHSGPGCRRRDPAGGGPKLLVVVRRRRRWRPLA